MTVVARLIELKKENYRLKMLINSHYGTLASAAEPEMLKVLRDALQLMTRCGCHKGRETVDKLKAIIQKE